VTFIATAAQAAEHYATHVVGPLSHYVSMGEIPAARELARGLPANVKPIVARKLAEAGATDVLDALSGALDVDASEDAAGRSRQLQRQADAFRAETARYQRLIAGLSR
jgi:hypothetical protein